MSTGKYQGAKLGLEWCRDITNEALKKSIAQRVANLAGSGQVIGAGSGSTSFLTVLALGQRCRDENLDVVIVPSSIEIQLASEASELNVCTYVPSTIDWCFDGADEVDPHGRLIKGRGGALYRERLIFDAAERRILVADNSKNVERLGCRFPVPVEVEPFWLRRAFDEIGSLRNVREVSLRMALSKDGPVITESGGLILDVWFNIIDQEDERSLVEVPGVKCTGIFSGYEFERI